MVIDRFPIFVLGLMQVLGDEGFDTTAATHLDVAPSHRPPDIFLVGTDGDRPPEAAPSPEPRRAGIDERTLRLVERASSLAPVLLMTAGLDSDAMSRCTRSGANGVVGRAAPPQRIVYGIRVVAAGGCFFDGPHVPPSHQPGNANGSALARLSPREREVLERIVRGMTREHTARAIGISHHTVDTYVRRIKSKLNANSVADLTRIATLEGIGFRPGRLL
jgi:DNA-binding NarL/FixJ family response regulator